MSTNATLTQPIRVAQLNAQCKKHMVTNLLNNFYRDFNLIILQEPTWGRIGNMNGKEVIGPVSLSGWIPIIPVTSPTQDCPCTMAYYQACPNFSIMLQTDIIEDKDIQILDITQSGHPTTSIINVYNNTLAQDLYILNRLRNVNISDDHPTIITRDFNLHHNLWSKINVILMNVEMTEKIVDWLSEKGFILLNKKGEVTHLA